jgi:TolB-like protein/Flp pilus assembly protein TadD
MSGDTSPSLVDLFGRLVEMGPDARAAQLAGLDLEPNDRAELDRLLALDERDSAWLDRLASTTLPDTLDEVFRAGAEGADLGEEWELLEVIGRGGMGVVHRARDRRLDRIVALKFLPVDRRRDTLARDRLLAEARAASSLDHPAIGIVHQIGVTGPGSGSFEPGQPFIAMAYYEGETLAERAARERISPAAILEWATQLADGLAHAHRAGIVHRDIKPSNVIVAADGRVRILDFGIAALRGSAAPGAGTRAYVSPEQLAGAPPRPEDDVWSFGVLLEELLAVPSGRAPADASTARLARNLARLAATCRAEDPALRPPDAGAVAEELRRIRRDVEERGRGPERPRVAVLPFADIGLGAENEWFVDGVMEEILGRLARLDGLRVTGRATAMRMKGRLLPADRIAEELGVRFLLEGGVRRVDDTVRVGVRLLDTAEDHYLWTDAFEGPVSDIFAIQERVALGVADALSVELSGADREELERRPLEDLRAWESYLRARHEAWRFSAEGIERARRHLNAALDIVGPNALLYSTLGHLEAISIDAGIAGGPDVLARVDAFADRTFELDPDSGRGSFLRAFAAMNRGEMARAVRAGRRALEALGSDPDVLVAYGYILARVGRTTEADELFRSAIRLDPLTPLNRCMPGFVALMEGRHDDAVEPYRQMMEMDPDNPVSPLFFGWALAYAGRTEEAIGVFGPASRRLPGTPFAAWAASFAAGLAGDTEGARTAITPALEAAATGSEMFARALAHCRALGGDVEGGVDALRSMVRLGMLCLPFIERHDRFIEPLRGHPEFQAILAEAQRRVRVVEDA